MCRPLRAPTPRQSREGMACGDQHRAIHERHRRGITCNPVLGVAAPHGDNQADHQPDDQDSRRCRGCAGSRSPPSHVAFSWRRHNLAIQSDQRWERPAHVSPDLGQRVQHNKCDRRERDDGEVVQVVVHSRIEGVKRRIPDQVGRHGEAPIQMGADDQHDRRADARSQANEKAEIDATNKLPRA